MIRCLCVTLAVMSGEAICFASQALGEGRLGWSCGIFALALILCLASNLFFDLAKSP